MGGELRAHSNRKCMYGTSTHRRIRSSPINLLAVRAGLTFGYVWLKAPNRSTGRQLEERLMKALLLAAAAISGLGTSSAHADGESLRLTRCLPSFPACSRRPSMPSRQRRTSRAWRIMPPSRTVSRGRSRQTRTVATTNKQRRELEAGSPTIARQSSGFAETPSGREARAMKSQERSQAFWIAEARCQSVV